MINLIDKFVLYVSTYNKYEKGSRKLSNEVFKKLAEY